MLKIYINPDNFFPNHPGSTNVISTLIWDLDLSSQGKITSKHHPQLLYEPDVAKADICVLTMLWNFYIKHSKENLADLEISQAEKNGKHIVIFGTRDYPAKIRNKNVVLFESAGLNSRNTVLYHSGLPFFINDYMDIYCQGTATFRHKRDVPSIGFCGQSNNSIIKQVWRASKNNYHKINYHLGIEKWEPPPFETTSFRGRVLNAFDDDRLETNFIVREKMRAGDPKIQSEQNRNKLAFIKNILESDYTICMRGHGNYSIRFYETLSLGRIPIFIDTDCLLPFQDEIDYKSLFPWIDVKDLPYAAEILLEFHNNLSNDEFINLQEKCRNLWLEHMTKDGFYRDFISKINTIVSVKN